MVSEIPLRVVGGEVVFCQGGGAVASGVEAVASVDAWTARDGFGHESESAIDELLDAPKLFVGAREGWHGSQLQIGGGSKGTVGVGDGDFVVGAA